MTLAAVRRLPKRFGNDAAVLAAGLAASAASLVLSVHAVRGLTLDEFGSFTLLVAFVHLFGAVGRAALGETSAGTSGDLQVARVGPAVGGLVAAAVAVPVFAIVVTVSALDGGLVLAAVVAASCASAGEISRVRTLTTWSGSALLVGDLVRLVLVITLPFVFDRTVEWLLVVLSLGHAASIVVAAIAPASGRFAVSARRAGTAAGDILVQRGAGQLVSLLIVSAAGAGVFGAISAARLVYAPLTTAHTSGASLVLVRGGLETRRVAAVVRATLAFSALYVVVASTATLTGGLGAILGGADDEIRSIVVPMGLFVALSAIAPAVSTSLRKRGRPTISLRARTVSGVALVAVMIVALYPMAVETATPIAWSYAGAGIVAALSWSWAYRRLVGDLERGRHVAA